MNIARRLCLGAVAGLLGFGLLGLSAPAAHAGDTSWGCGGCKVQTHHR
jgi:hypothetical protein